MPNSARSITDKALHFSATPAYTTDWGQAFCGDSLDLLSQMPDESVNLVMTSPPFALQRKKEYGNKDQSEYIAWLSEFARIVLEKLREDGSFVLDLGGAYRKGVPVSRQGCLGGYTEGCV